MFCASSTEESLHFYGAGIDSMLTDLAGFGKSVWQDKLEGAVQSVTASPVP